MKRGAVLPTKIYVRVPPNLFFFRYCKDQMDSLEELNLTFFIATAPIYIQLISCRRFSNSSVFFSALQIASFLHNFILRGIRAT